MAAGLGFKTFTTGEVLTSADTNGYLMQGVLVFASAAARDAAITSPQEGQCCYLKDTDAVQTYSGSAWVGFDDSNAIQNTIVAAKGDIIGASANDVPAVTSVGANETRLVADSAQTTGLKYVADTTNYAIGAKGDLLVGSAADTVAAMTVGADYSFVRALASATNGVEWVSGWTAYTPVWTSDGSAPTLGNATLTGAYMRVGKTVNFRISFTRGSTSANGTGSYFFSLPFGSNFSSTAALGTFYLEDSGTAGYVGIITQVSSTTILLRVPSNTAVGATNPFTWATNDFFHLSGTYEVA